MHPFERYRKNHKLTQEDLATLLEFSPAMISHIETGRRVVPAIKVLDFEKLLNNEVSKHELRSDLYPIEPPDNRSGVPERRKVVRP